MTVKQFIRARKQDIDRIIKEAVYESLLTNEEREQWIYNDPELREFAQSQGVEIEC